MSPGPDDAATAVAPPRPVTPVSILSARLAALRERLGPDLGPPDRAELDELCALAGGLDPYLERATTPESPDLARLDAATRAHDWGAAGDAALGLEQEMLSGHVEGQALKALVHLTRARRVLEVGMFTGYSALAMAEAVDEVCARDGGSGEVVACEVDAEVAAFARGCFDASASGARIRTEVAPAADTLRRLADAGEVFDLVFVDADKAGYATYLDLVLGTGLLAPHGVVAVDNTLMQGQPWVGDRTANGEAIAAFNDAVAADPRVEQVLLPLRDGLTLIRRA